jgi:trans-aconitate 2-methyltransferase
MPEWNPDLYLKFAGERTQPTIDLIAKIAIADPRRIIDLGCGPGNSTIMLKARWPDAQLLGLDNSPDMIAAAKAEYPDLNWIESDIIEWKAEEPFDLIFSNAALHWVPDHGKIFPHLINQLSSNGVLAVQMPTHFQSHVHRRTREIALDAEWQHLTGQALQAIKVERPSFYYDLLQPQVTRLDLWETDYIHVLEDHQAIVDWIRGTGLRPFLQALESDEQRARFEKMLLEGVSQDYPKQKDGRVLFFFRRLFIVAYR